MAADRDRRRGGGLEVAVEDLAPVDCPGLSVDGLDAQKTDRDRETSIIQSSYVDAAT